MPDRTGKIRFGDLSFEEVGCSVATTGESAWDVQPEPRNLDFGE